MTLKEADEAAQKLLPVEYNGVEYKRISRSGYWYDQQGNRHSFVELRAMSGNSVTWAMPEAVKVKEEQDEGYTAQ